MKARFILVASSFVIAANARAEDSAVGQADTLFKDGRRAADHGDYAQACKLFEESFRLDPAVGTLINLGDCDEHLGDLEHAWGFYRTAYARMSGGDDRAARVHERVVAIEQHAAKITLALADAPNGTVVTVDGVAVDPEKAPLHLAAGAHVVIATAVGYRGARYDLAVTEGETRTFRLSPGPALEAVLPNVPSTNDADKHVPWTRPVAIATLGVGVASVWIGSLAGLMAIDRRDVQRAQCSSAGCTEAGVSAASDGATWAAASTAAFVIGGVLVAGGATLLVLSFGAHKSVSVGWSPRGLVIGGSFH